MSLKIGEINYTNIMPMFFYLNREELQKQGFTFNQATPAQLNKQMSEGLIDIGGISSFEYARNPENYLILPDLSVSSIGSVGSIFLFSKVPAAELDGASVALTSSSATSVHLLKVILHQFYSVSPVYKTESPSLEDMLGKNDACLLIGDDAIKASWETESDLFKYDLGDIWFRWTGFPMTYALFAVRKEAARQFTASLQELYEGFHWSKQKNTATSYQELTAEILHSIGGTEDFWKKYFQQLNFELTAEHLKGLSLFFNKLYEAGYIKVNKEIELWHPVRNDFINKVDIK